MAENVQGWTAMPNWMLRDKTLSGHAKLVYLSISSRIGLPDNHPSHATIAAEASCSPATVKRALVELRDRQMIEWESRTDGKGGQISNRYRILIEPPVNMNRGGTHHEPPPHSR